MEKLYTMMKRKATGQMYIGEKDMTFMFKIGRVHNSEDYLGTCILAENQEDAITFGKALFSQFEAGQEKEVNQDDTPANA